MNVRVCMVGMWVGVGLFLLPQLASGDGAIPWSDIGARASAEYQGDGLVVSEEGEGAKLTCVFQRLEGNATPAGLWLTSVVEGQPRDRFRVVASAINDAALSGAGEISIHDGRVQFMRPGLVEEYSVSVDGVRQDFVVLAKPEGAGTLRVGLSVDGAEVRETVGGAELALAESGRRIAYSRLRVTDAEGKELAARIEVGENSAARAPRQAREARALPEDEDSNYAVMGEEPAFPGEIRNPKFEMAIVVEDRGAVYPVRIDPTFSDANWYAMNTGLAGVEGSVNAVYVETNGTFYIGGNFDYAGDVYAGSHVARWNGTNWVAIGTPLVGNVYAITKLGGNLYVGGFFTSLLHTNIKHVARWSPPSNDWVEVGASGGLNGAVRALTVDSQSYLIAAGQFTKIGVGTTANRIAYSDELNWYPLGVPGLNGSAYALAVMGTNLYVGGGFSTAGSTNVKNIVRWDGAKWSSVGAGVGDWVYALAALKTNVLYVGGMFTNAGILSANGIAAYFPSANNWTKLGDGIDGTVYALAIPLGGGLFAGGDFLSAGGKSAKNIAWWNGAAWTNVEAGFNRPVWALGMVNPTNMDVLAGGDFTASGARSLAHVARSQGLSPWSDFGKGLNGDVLAIAVGSSNVYIGGKFTRMNGTNLNYIARWNGTSWGPIGGGMNDWVAALATSGNDLYAGGFFTNAGGDPANYVAKWDGSGWNAMADGFDNPVLSLTLLDTNLCAGGVFSFSGATIVRRVARWSGSHWMALGSGISSGAFPAVYALATDGTNVYAGGEFTSAGGAGITNIARWNGSTWSNLGRGTDARVNALAWSDGKLYAGGAFLHAHGSPANHIARWDGTVWNALGDGVDDEVFAVAASGKNVYIGGSFLHSGADFIPHIAHWNGSEWKPIGSGAEGGSNVFALALSGSRLFVGGDFVEAGDKMSPYIAKLEWPGELPELTIFFDGAATRVRWPFVGAEDAMLESTDRLVPSNWTNDNHTVFPEGTNRFIVISPPTTNAQFFRLRD